MIIKDWSTTELALLKANEELKSTLLSDVRSIGLLEANLRDRLEGLERMLNKTIDAHEVTRQRLFKYENEVGTPHNKGISDHRLNG